MLARFGIAALFALHGLIHLMGVIAYWELADLADLPYQTTLLNGRWEVGDGGMRLFGFAWLVATAGFVAAAIGIVSRRAWWHSTVVMSAALSLAICSLVWSDAWRGVLIDVVILTGIAIVSVAGPRVSGERRLKERVR